MLLLVYHCLHFAGNNVRISSNVLKASVSKLVESSFQPRLDTELHALLDATGQRHLGE